MKPIDYYKTLTRDQRVTYASKAGTTLNYLVAHVFRDGAQIRRPSNSLLIGLASASEGQVSLDEAIDYFLIQPVRKLAAELESSQRHVTAKQVAAELKGFDGADKPESFYQQAL